MKGKRYSTETKIRILREAESSDKTIQDVCRERQISEQTFHRWKREFPNMMRSISAYKWKCDASGEKGTTKFANKLHGIEAAIIADVAKKCMDRYIPCVSVFDGMLVPANDAQVVKDFFIDVLTKRLGFAPEPSVGTAGGVADMRLEVNG